VTVNRSCNCYKKTQSAKGTGSPYSITERKVPKLIPVLGSQPAGDVSHKPGGRLPLLSARPAVTLATLKRAATNFAAWWTEAWSVWIVCVRLLPDSVAAAILNPGPTEPESSMLTTQLPSHPRELESFKTAKMTFNVTLTKPPYPIIKWRIEDDFLKKRTY